MDFLMNDLSIHGQFNSTDEFVHSVDALMEIRQVIRRAGRELFCHRGLRAAQVTTHNAMPQAIQGMPNAKRRAWMQWLTRVGPHWQDDRWHSGDDWLERNGEPIFTDHAVGEAAYRGIQGNRHELVSFDPSDWLLDPITVTWRKSDESKTDIDVPNHWSLNTVTTTLESLPKPFDSWQSLEEHLRRACDELTISDDAFKPLEGHPYVKSVGEGVVILLNALNKLDSAFDKDGNRTAEFESLYDIYFKGDTPYFTDESTTNKRGYRLKLTFPHPEKPGEALFCSWHGKVNSPRNFPPIRIHFTWPATAKSTLYVVHVGPKITTH